MVPRKTPKLRAILAGRKTASKSTKTKTTGKKKTVKKKRSLTAVVSPLAASSLPLACAIAPEGTVAAGVDPSAPLRPKAEYSPNALAKCKGCSKKIRKEDRRYGIPERSARYNKEIYRYWHFRCCPDELKAQVPNAIDDLKRQKQEASVRERKIEQHKVLGDQLRTMRDTFASRLSVSDFLIFTNATLDELVYKMPITKAALLEVRGIGPGKQQSFGDPILRLIQQYKHTNKNIATTTAGSLKRRPNSSLASRRNVSKKAASVTAPEVITIDDSDDDELAVCATLTCEQLVNQKFAHAAANGYIVSID